MSQERHQEVLAKVYDLVIKGGRVFDGTGSPWFWADLGIKDGKIATIARVIPGELGPLDGKALSVIHVGGKTVSPGFIDIHSHSDLPLLANRTADSKIMQGVTTEVVGQCGNSPAPIDDNALPLMKDTSRGIPDIAWNWRSYGEYLERLESNGTSVNVCGLVGHGTVRKVAMGFAERRPSADELSVMQRLVRQSVEEGAYGLSTGLIYTPQSFSETDEVAELARAAAVAGGQYFTHLRAEGERVVVAINEALEIGRRAGLPVQIAHLKAFGLARGRGQEIVDTLESARREGIDVTADQYPYIASSTGLAAFLPPWVHDGGRDKMVERLRDPATRKRIRADMQRTLPGWSNDFRLPWSDVQVAKCGTEDSFQGKRIQQIADEQGKDAYEMAFDMLTYIDPGTSVVIFGMAEEDVRLIMKSDLVTIGSDGSALNPVGPLGQGQPHPRNYGTMPRVLGRYVREQGVLTLANAIRKMTSASANRLGLKDRGQLREGFWADIVVFDPDTIADQATFDKPHQFPAGIDYVIVNGKLTVSRGTHTGALAGQVLRRS